MRRALVIALLVGPGCAASMAGRAAGPLVDNTMDALDTPENRAHLGSVLGSPEVREGTRVLAADAATGAMEGLVDEAVVEEMVRRATQAAAAEFALSLRSELGPAMRRIVQEELRPEARDFLQDDVGPMLKDIAADLSRGIVQGIVIAAREVQEAEDFPEQRLLNRVRQVIESGIRMLRIAAIFLFLVFVMLVALALRRLRTKVPPPAGAKELRPQVREALRELLADPETRQLLAEELRRHEDQHPLPH